MFASETVDFEKLLQEDIAGGPEEKYFPLELRTLGGSQHILHDLHGKMLVADVKRRAAELVGAPAFTLKLIMDDQTILNDHEVLDSVGLSQNPSVTLLRCPTDRQVWRKLFYDLVIAINRRNSQGARHLIDQGAGFDDKGNVLKAARSMQQPGNYAVENDQPGSTMLHLAIREGLRDLAFYLVSRVENLDAPNEVGRTPLMMAVFKKHMDVAEALIRAKASVLPRDYLNHSALVYAMKCGNDTLLAQLVDAAGDARCSELDDAFHCLGLQSDDLSGSSSSTIQQLAWACHKSGFQVTSQLLLQTAGLDLALFASNGVDEICCYGIAPEAEKSEVSDHGLDSSVLARCMFHARWMKWMM
jgi:hypothetical protein